MLWVEINIVPVKLLNRIPLINKLFLQDLKFYCVRFFKQYLLLLALNQMSSALFRFVAGLGRDMVASQTFAPLSLLAFTTLDGFILSRRKLLDFQS
jgi:hypothetical protein